MRRGLPAVVAMQYAITDRAAIEFTHTFYESIADGLPVDTAVAEARVSMSLALPNTLEWGTPVLTLRAPDGHLFRLADAPNGQAARPHSGNGPSGEGLSNAVTVHSRNAGPIAFDWVTIPAGEFLMGSDKAKDKDASDDELPQHRLYLPAYRISRASITNAQYKIFVDATGHIQPDALAKWSYPRGQNRSSRG